MLLSTRSAAKPPFWGNTNVTQIDFSPPLPIRPTYCWNFYGFLGIPMFTANVSPETSMPIPATSVATKTWQLPSLKDCMTLSFLVLSPVNFSTTTVLGIILWILLNSSLIQEATISVRNLVIQNSWHFWKLESTIARIRKAKICRRFLRLSLSRLGT